MEPDHFPLNPTEAMKYHAYCGVCDRKFYAISQVLADQELKNHFAYTHPVDQDQGTI